MDTLDFAIYRYLSPGGEARFWAGRRIIDPRVTPREIAERVHLSESGVRTRLSRLAQSGYLRDRIAVPNPSLVGKRAFVADLRIRQPSEVEHLLRDLAFIHGVMFARDVLDEEQRTLQVYFAADDAVVAARTGGLLGRLLAGGAPIAARPYYIPELESPLTPLLAQALRFLLSRPDASLSEIAAANRVSLKTAARTYRALIERRACWWTHGPESEEVPLAMVRARLESARFRDDVLESVGEWELPWLPVASDGFGLEPDRAGTELAGLVPSGAPTVLERLVRRLTGAEGVVEVHRTFALGSAVYPGWFPQLDIGVAGVSDPSGRSKAAGRTKIR